jgi:hypothetical protein
LGLIADFLSLIRSRRSFFPQTTDADHPRFTHWIQLDFHPVSNARVRSTHGNVLLESLC